MALPRLCLNMIVRDESHVIIECLETVAPHIDYWVICDTGSEDDTPDIIERHFAEKGIPGELHHHEWKDFGHNRTRALEAARGKAQYAWVIDADDFLVGQPDFSNLTNDSYDLYYRLGDNCSYWRRQVFRLELPWVYKGVVHEYPHCDAPHNAVRLPGAFHIEARRLGGARNRDKDKYARDVELLEQAHADDPGDARTVFYLAQSHYDHRNLEQAEHWYRKRATMGGFDEEMFYSLMRVGLALEARKSPPNVVIAALLEAWEHRPQRAEALCHAARICRLNKRWNQAYLYAGQAMETPFPEKDMLFVDESVWKWRAKDERAIAAYWTERYAECASLSRELLKSGDLPKAQLQRVKDNLKFAKNPPGG